MVDDVIIRENVGGRREDLMMIGSVVAEEEVVRGLECLREQ